MDCVKTFLAAVDLAQPRVDPVEFETPFSSVDRVKLSCNVNEIFAVVQTSSGAFWSAQATGISMCATENPRFEFCIESARAQVHLSKSRSHSEPAVSTTVFEKNTSTVQPFVKLDFESKRCNVTRSQPPVVDSQKVSPSDNPGTDITSELGVAKALGWKDSDSLSLMEQHASSDFPEVAVFTVVGAVCGSHICINLDDLLRITFFRSLVLDVLQMTTQMQDAGFTANGLFSNSVSPASPYHAFCSQMPSHPFLSSPQPPPSQSERTASHRPLCILSPSYPEIS